MTDNSIQDIASNPTISFPFVYGENVERMYPNVRISIERITPDIAEKMLTTNISNRDINRFSAVMTALENNEWELNGATIIFDESGILIDGQHRLTACVRTGKPICTIVVRGISHNTQVTMDTGISRKLRDYTKMRGFKNYSTVASVGLALYIVDNYGLRAYFMSHRGGKATYKAVINFIDDNYEQRIKPLVDDVRAMQAKYRKVNSGTISAVFDAFTAAGKDDYEEFVKQLTHASPACVSIRILQTALSKNATTTDRVKQLTQKHIAAYMIKTWNAYITGVEIKQLKFNQGGAHPESFPEVFLGYE